jgi:diguanylate cyclase (GGDEF)-like protein
MNDMSQAGLFLASTLLQSWHSGGAGSGAAGFIVGVILTIVSWIVVVILSRRTGRLRTMTRERKDAEETIVRLARSDVLTGLPNRAVFVEALEEAIVRARRGGRKFAVLYLDLDHFKDINDTLGHPVGDAVLQVVASRLQGQIRATDTVARFGGDEFAILQSDLKDSEDAALCAGQLLEILAEPMTIGEGLFHTSGSIGIAIHGDESLDAETLLAHADVALYRAKAEGRSTFRFFSEAMDVEFRSNVALVADIRRAIAGEQFFVVYQALVEMGSGRIIGLEALLRWRHPERGILAPEQFIPTAERSGLIRAVCRWILRQACRQTKAWLDAGIAPAFTSVNVSAVQFKAPRELERDLAAILAETGLPPARLAIELTETAVMEAWRNHQETLTSIRAMGIRIAIDDFGTGYSSLEYLRRRPVDWLKIAPAFVSRITASPSESAIVKATICLARELNLDVIAVGVETEAQAKLLEGWGCRHAQGFYFSEPLSVDDLTPLLRRGGVDSPAPPGAVRDGSAGAVQTDVTWATR